MAITIVGGCGCKGGKCKPKSAPKSGVFKMPKKASAKREIYSMSSKKEIY